MVAFGSSSPDSKMFFRCLLMAGTPTPNSSASTLHVARSAAGRFDAAAAQREGGLRPEEHGPVEECLLELA